MQSIVIYIHSFSMIRLSAADYVSRDRRFLIWEQARECCQEICIVMVQNGQLWIFQKIRLNRLKFFQKIWKLIIMLFQQKISVSKINILMLLRRANAFGILIISR